MVYRRHPSQDLVDRMIKNAESFGVSDSLGRIALHQAFGILNFAPLAIWFAVWQSGERGATGGSCGDETVSGLKSVRNREVILSRIAAGI